MDETQLTESVHHLEIVEKTGNEASISTVAAVASKVQAADNGLLEQGDRHTILAMLIVHHYLVNNHFEPHDINELNPRPPYAPGPNLVNYTRRAILSDDDVFLLAVQLPKYNVFSLFKEEPVSISASMRIWNDEVEFFTNNEQTNIARRFEVTHRIDKMVEELFGHKSWEYFSPESFMIPYPNGLAPAQMTELVYHLEMLEKIVNEEALTHMVATIASNVQAADNIHLEPGVRHIILATLLVHHYLVYNHFESRDISNLNSNVLKVPEKNLAVVQYTSERFDYEVVLLGNQYPEYYSFCLINGEVSSRRLMIRIDEVEFFTNKEQTNIALRCEVVHRIGTMVQNFLRNKTYDHEYCESPTIC